jgi:hypothetical protein
LPIVCFDEKERLPFKGMRVSMSDASTGTKAPGELPTARLRR